jgi:Uma2 family endonuclease
MTASDQAPAPGANGPAPPPDLLRRRWIRTIAGNLDEWFRADPNVLVLTETSCHPEQSTPELFWRPDVMVVFGRPRGYRDSYRFWEEASLPPQVVFEVGGAGVDPLRKLSLAQEFGVEEYYVHDPAAGETSGWVRQDDGLRLLPHIDGWVSPRLGARFSAGRELTLEGPEGRPFWGYVELLERQLDQERQRADSERERANQQVQRTERERYRKREERHRAEREFERAERLAARLRSMGLDPDSPAPPASGPAPTPVEDLAALDPDAGSPTG